MIVLHDIDPIALHLPFWPHGIHWYGLMYVAGFAIAWWLGQRRRAAGRLPGIDDNAYGDLLFYGMLGVIVGGRLGYVLFYEFAAFVQDPLLLLRIRDGGMSIHGGLLAVLAAVFWWSRKHRLHYFDVLDFVAPLTPIGIGLGRVGNFINGELWGRLTTGQFGVVFPNSDLGPYTGASMAQLREAHAQGLLDAYARYPSQLLQIFLEGALLFVILWLFSTKARARYAVSGLFALLYGVFRIFAEFYRQPDAHLGYLAFGWFTMGMLLSLPLVILGLVLLWRSTKQPLPTSADQGAP